MFDLEVTEVSSLEEYRIFAFRIGQKTRRREFEVREFIKKSRSSVVTGFCCICKANMQFSLPLNHANTDSEDSLNWRECLECSACHLNNRKRGSFHLFELFGVPQLESAIYVTEQRSPFYSALNKLYPRTVGSEYYGTSYPYGEERLIRVAHDQMKIRNETITALTFQDNCFDFVLSFEVFEHIPDYRKALCECWRCLKQGGKLFFTVPFNTDSQPNIARSVLNPDGTIVHLLPPEYHSDPEQEGGILAYHNFGWDLLKDLREIGFRKATGLFCWSLRFVYWGRSNIVFMAQK
ncbi:MAG: class I SAM-dependent methyltransferase [Terriglobia bacterium]